MVNIYTYNDLRGFNTKLHNVKSNLCTYYYKDKKKFCGNYISKKPPHGYIFNKRCWRHKRPKPSAMLPPVVLLVISASERTYNRDTWLVFLEKCEKYRVPLELVIYHEDMYNCTVRDPQNMVSRFRPFPEIYGKVLPLRHRHGSVNFTQICNEMLEYGCKIPHASRCILLTERTIPIRSPRTVYRRALDSKCHIDISYNIGYAKVPDSVPKGVYRNKPYSGVNNLCQGLYTVEFLKEALPTLPVQCEKFGLSVNNGVYTITNRPLFEQWRAFTGANPSEFWLLNSYLLQHRNHPRPMALVKQFMENTPESDKYVVAEIPEWRDGWKRTFVFKSFTTKYQIPKFNNRAEIYYKGMNFRNGVSLLDVVHYVRRYKKRALFFRQVEMP
jgi:hypothetical protein